MREDESADEAAAPDGAGVSREPKPRPPQELRPYQVDVDARIEAAIAEGHRRILMVAPTGSGKTTSAAHIVRRAEARGQSVLFLAHRLELIEQAHQRLFEFGIDSGVIKAGLPMRLAQPVQVAGIQTLTARAIRGRTIELPKADLVIVDECHHARAETWQAILDRYPKAVIIGLTATPCRGDGRGLGNIFDTMIECPQVGALIAAGYLVPTKVYAPTTPDLKGVAVRQGDYAPGELESRMDRPKLVGDVVSHWHRLGMRRLTVVFASGVAHSTHIRDEFRRSGVLAEHIDGTTPLDERRAILTRLDRGEIDLVSNAMVLTEGWDSPSVSCIVLARPTRQLGLYRQMVGRVLRPAPGKADALVLDHAGATLVHGFAEDDIVWTLSTDRRAMNKTQAARGMNSARSLTTCPECSAVRYQGKPCPACGWRPKPKPIPVDVAEGELGAVDRQRRVSAANWSQAEKDTFYRELLGLAEERGYRPGFAYYKFVERFNVPPTSSDRWRPSPLPPSDATRSWVRSRQIAYARAKAQ